MVEEYGITLPFCPFCHEPAYEKTHCVFCGAEFEELSKQELEKQKKTNHEITVKYKNITIHQVCCGAYIFRDGKFISHASLTKPQNEKQLLQMAKHYAGEKKL